MDASSDGQNVKFIKFDFEATTPTGNVNNIDIQVNTNVPMKIVDVDASEKNVGFDKVNFNSNAGG